MIGIEGDGFVGDEDKYGRQIHDIFMEACGEFAASLITVTFERIEDKTVCRILCKKSSKPVYCTYKNNGEKAFVRYGSTTKSPSLSEWDRWRENNF